MADYHPGHPDGEHARRERGQHFFGVLRPEHRIIKDQRDLRGDRKP
jgi:hypothetical protein